MASNPSRLIKPKMVKGDEQCEPCNHQVAADMALSICETIGQEKFGIDCRKLRIETREGRNKPLGVAKRIRDIAKRKNLPQADQLDEIYRLGKDGI